MVDESNSDDGGTALVSRRGLLGVLGAGALGVGAATSQSDDGVLSAGGAAPGQSNVPVHDILVVFEEDTHDVDGTAYTGADVRPNGELRFGDGNEIGFSDP